MSRPGVSVATFEDFVCAETSTLFSTALLLTGSRDRGEELLQDTLTALYPRWDRVENAERPVAYVRRALINRFLNNRRSAGRELLVWDVPEGWQGGDLAERVATSRTVWQLLGELGDRQRAALVLRYFHDLDDHQIAASLDCRRGTARSLISRGLAAMRERLDDGATGTTKTGAQR